MPKKSQINEYSDHTKTQLLPYLPYVEGRVGAFVSNN